MKKNCHLYILIQWGKMTKKTANTKPTHTTINETQTNEFKKKKSTAFLRGKLKPQSFKPETNNLTLCLLSSHIKKKTRSFPHAHLFLSNNGKTKKKSNN